MDRDRQFSLAPRLETARLTLRPHRKDDFLRLAQFYQSPRSRYAGGMREGSAAWSSFAAMVGHWPLLGFGAWAIEVRETGDYVGQAILNAPHGWPENELGWRLWEEFEGLGYAHEAAVCAREFAFGALGWKTAVSYVDPDNTRSIRLAERLGAVLDPRAPTPRKIQCLVYRHDRPAGPA